ncbi:hypothetical protein ACHAPT_005345 [Fusarium lateritium]
MLSWRNGAQSPKEDGREREEVKEAEVQAALAKAEKTWSEGGSVPFHIVDGYFRLKYVEFYDFDEDGNSDDSGQRARDGKSLLNGHLYLNSWTDCQFAPFLPPLEASLEPFETKAIKSEGEYTFAF